MKRKLFPITLMVTALTMAVGCSSVTDQTEDHPTNETTSDTKSEVNIIYESNGDGTCSVVDFDDVEEVVIPEYSPAGDKVTEFLCRSKKNHLKKLFLSDSIMKISETLSRLRSLENIKLSKNIETIEWQTFHNCSSLKEVVLPEKLKTIADEAFRNCESLVEIHIPEGCEEIGASAFEGCHGLKVVDLPNSLKTTSANAFYDCTSLSSITLPMNMISDFDFGYCTSLTEVNIEDSVQEIGTYTFESTGIRKIFLPKSITKVYRYAFWNCDPELTVYCEAEEKPDGWTDEWNRLNYNTLCSVVWNATRDDAK